MESRTVLVGPVRMRYNAQSLRGRCHSRGFGTSTGARPQGMGAVGRCASHGSLVAHIFRRICGAVFGI